MSNKPKLKPPIGPAGVIMEELALAGLIVLILLPAFHYINLPDQVPSHFNMLGKADAFAHKSSVWILPAVGLILYFTLAILTKYPHKFNYPVKITKENAAKQYAIALLMIRSLKAIICCSFAYITYKIINAHLAENQDLHKGFVPFFTFLMLAVTGYFYYISTLDEE